MENSYTWLIVALLVLAAVAALTAFLLAVPADGLVEHLLAAGAAGLLVGLYVWLLSSGLRSLCNNPASF